MNTTKPCLNCNGEMIERNPGNYICSNCAAEMTAEDKQGIISAIIDLQISE
jgi:uncharacterized Zn ribbon protein